MDPGDDPVSRGRSAIRAASALVAIAALVASCKSDSAFNPGPVDTTGTGGGGSGGVTKATLAVTVIVDPADASVRDALGWATGIPSAEVTIQRSGSATSTQTATTDASGVAHFSGLLPGSYTVSFVRLLAAAERGQLAAGDADVNAFGGGTTVSVSAPSASATIAAPAGRPGSLVISELFVGWPNAMEAGEYPLASYIELYNNSDTTVYLDGKIVGMGQVWSRDYQSPRSCADMAQWRLDPDGIWTRNFYQFPGSGRTYPLTPGHATVVATDAIDERQLYPELMDLSGSQFEFVGPSDVDNPASINMINIGLGEWAASVFGHGLFWGRGDVTAYVANPVDVASLPHSQLPVVEPDYVRMPASALLDVFTSSETPELEANAQYGHTCGQQVSPAIDRQQATLSSGNDSVSSNRKVLFQTSTGRKVLLRTRTSARDFELDKPNPGTLP